MGLSHLVGIFIQYRDYTVWSIHFCVLLKILKNHKKDHLFACKNVRRLKRIDIYIPNPRRTRNYGIQRRQNLQKVRYLKKCIFGLQNLIPGDWYLDLSFSFTRYFRLCPDDRHRECTKQESEDPKVRFYSQFGPVFGFNRINGPFTGHYYIMGVNPYPRFFGTITERVFWKKTRIIAGDVTVGT